MAPSRSFTTLLCMLVCARAVPVADDSDDCWEPPVDVPSYPSAAVLAPHRHLPAPHPSPTQHPHATLPVPHPPRTPVILGTTFGVLLALLALAFTARYVIRRRRPGGGPFADTSEPGFSALFRSRHRAAASQKRLSDESWVSPTLPTLGSPGSPFLHDFEWYHYARRKLVPVTTPVCTPTETEFGSRLEFASADPSPAIPVPPVRVPLPVYVSPLSPSISSSASLSPTPSTEPLNPPSPNGPNPARLSRLLSSTFGDTRSDAPSRPTTIHLIQTARSYAQAYRPSSATSASLYSPPGSAGRLDGIRSRTSFYPGPAARDTISTVTTSDTDMVCTVPHLLRGVAAASPFVDLGHPVAPSASASSFAHAPIGTMVGLKLRLSDASEHAHYRQRERERHRQRQSADSCQSVTEPARSGFKLRDSESVLHEIGW